MRLEEFVHIRCVVIEPYDISERKPRRFQHGLQILKCHLDLFTHVADVNGAALFIDRCLSRTVQNTTAAGHFNGLRKSKLILPVPWINLSLLHCVISSFLFSPDIRHVRV